MPRVAIDGFRHSEFGCPSDFGVQTSDFKPYGGENIND